MCGLFGILAGRSVSLGESELARLRDTMTHRGPDGAGLWRRDGCILAHRRLKVIDTTEGAAQPMVSADGRFAIVYNGELYNDGSLREDLSARGVVFRTASDTETVLETLARDGVAALTRLRGMYALALYDTIERRLWLARDPLGIKPLYYRAGPTADGPAVVFASEPRAIVEHPDVPCRPDPVALSAYLSTIRTVMGERTLFEGVRTVRPGEVVSFRVDGELDQTHSMQPRAPRGPAAEARVNVHTTVTESVFRHLRADVPVACMLSGGLDSSIIATIARRAKGSLATYCSGVAGAEDFAFARDVARAIGSRHTEAPVSREMFATRWPEMVDRLGVPLSTPNEVAINEVARRLRADGNIVALSGEGADELFAGYEIPMLDAARFEGLLPRVPDGNAPWMRPGILHGGDFQLVANAWIQPSDKGAILAGDVWRACEQDEMLRAFYRDEFDAARGSARDDSLAPHLRFHQRVNLAGLLSRLDTATMLEGVEGRTPFADRIVWELAESLPMADKFTCELSSHRFAEGADHRAAVKAHTKRILRSAFEDLLPPEVIARPKASFPLPMEWVADQAGRLRRSRFAREVFTLAAIETVAAEPSRCWSLAWPMMNAAMWGDHWWA